MISIMLNAVDNYGEDGCDDDDDCDKFASNFDFTGVQKQQHESPVQFHFSGNIINISLKKFN